MVQAAGWGGHVWNGPFTEDGCYFLASSWPPWRSGLHTDVEEMGEKMGASLLKGQQTDKHWPAQNCFACCLGYEI
jgi:hypothetical protein